MHPDELDAPLGERLAVPRHAGNDRSFGLKGFAVITPTLARDVRFARPSQSVRAFERELFEELGWRAGGPGREHARPGFAERDVRVGQQALRVVEIGADRTRQFTAQGAPTTFTDARQNRGDDQRPEASPEPIFVCSDTKFERHARGRP